MENNLNKLLTPLGSLIFGGIIGHYLTPSSYQLGAAIGCINGLTVALASREVKHPILYPIASLALLNFALKIALPCLKGRIEVPSPASLLLLGIPPLILSIIQQSDSPSINETEKNALIPEILTFFKVPESKYSRRYPPVSPLVDTMTPPSAEVISNLETLISKLEPLSPKKYPFYANKTDEPFKRVDYLSILLESVYPDQDYLHLSPIGHYGYFHSYPDEAILSVSKTVREETIHEVKLRFSDHNKPILLQQGIRGCTAACTAMLIYEHCPSLFNKKVVSELKTTNLGNTETMVFSLKTRGLKPIVTAGTNLDEMQRLISQNGPAIVAVDSCGYHAIMVDAITDTSVLIRDPFHGWEVTLTREAFIASKPSTMIQVEKTTISNNSLS